jgi:predicted GIY-YIG superfamily endonuclease
MFYVYHLRSQSFPDKTYIGFSTDLKQRLADHNAGKSIYTKDFKPWTLIGFLGFDSEIKALRFEQHLKTNAGRIFLRRYFNDQEKVSNT